MVSPLTRRILAVNVLALGILVAGLLYLDEYRRFGSVPITDGQFISQIIPALGV